MVPSEASDFDLFCRSAVLQKFSPDDLKELFSLSKPYALKAGEVLIRKGDRGDSMFFVLRGSLGLERGDMRWRREECLERISPGEIVGELSFIDGSNRSATVYAHTDADLRSISFTDLERFASQSIQHSRIYVSLSKYISLRLRATNEREIKEFQTRFRMGAFLIYIIMVLCVYSYSLSTLSELMQTVHETSYITLPLTIILGSVMLLMMMHTGLSWSEFGITLRNWKRAVLDGLLYPIPLVLGVMGLYWLAEEFRSAHNVFAVVDYVLKLSTPPERTSEEWVILLLIYWLIVVPIQELCTRGGLQGSLEMFLASRHKQAIAIVLSNLIFGAIHLYFSFALGLTVFFGGMYIGWIYSKTRNLIAGWLSHAILGSWYMSLVGF
jgi:CRP-like cAMP-binding protein